MDSTFTSSNKTQFILNQGAILGGINVFLLIILYYTETLFGSGWPSLAWLIYFIFVPWSITQYRKRFQDGIISYGQSFAHGIRITALSGVLIGFFYFIVLKVIDPELIKVVIAEAQETYLAMGFTEKQVEDMSEGIEMVSNPWLLMFSGIVGSLFYGLIVAFIVSFITTRKGDPFKEVMKTVENE